MSALLLSTACMRGLWPLLMSWLERKKKHHGKSQRMQSGNAKKPWCCETHSAESVQQGLTMALMSAPASSNILAKSLRPCRTARWRGLKPKNNKKKEKPAFYIHVQIFYALKKQISVTEVQINVFKAAWRFGNATLHWHQTTKEGNVLFPPTHPKQPTQPIPEGGFTFFIPTNRLLRQLRRL